MSEQDHVLECQTCGDVLQRLTREQAQHVANDPYSFVMFCGECKRKGAHIEEPYRDGRTPS